MPLPMTPPEPKQGQNSASHGFADASGQPASGVLGQGGELGLLLLPGGAQLAAVDIYVGLVGIPGSGAVGGDVPAAVGALLHNFVPGGSFSGGLVHGPAHSIPTGVYGGVQRLADGLVHLLEILGTYRPVDDGLDGISQIVQIPVIGHTIPPRRKR